MTEAPYEMANLFPKHTGLPFVVWINVRGGARQGSVMLKVSRNGNAIPAATISADIRIIEGSIDANEFELLKRWIELNRQTLIAYWEGDIDTQDALEALRKVE
jgi:hypothetical protein